LPHGVGVGENGGTGVGIIRVGITNVGKSVGVTIVGVILLVGMLVGTRVLVGT